MWKTIECCVQGSGHISTGTPCQDKTISVTENEVTSIALADGAGSAILSDMGAETAVRSMCEYICQHFDELSANADGVAVKKQLLQEVNDRLLEVAVQQGCLLEDLASTLLLVAIKKETFIMMHIGDGVIGYTKEGKVKVASKPANGEYSNETYFTTSPDAIRTMSLIKGNLQEIDGFILMSDGTEMSLYDKGTNTLAPVIGRIFSMLSFLPKDVVSAKVEDSMRTVIHDATADDCSIAIVARTKEMKDGFASLDPMDQMKILGIDEGKAKPLYKVARVLEILDRTRGIEDISRRLRVKKVYLKDTLSIGLGAGLISFDGYFYKRTL